MRDPSTEDTKFAVVHAGPSAIEDLPGLVRNLGHGRAFVLFDREGDPTVRSYVECAFDAAAMQVRVVEIGSNALEVGEVQQVAAELAHFAGAALVTVGSSEIIAAGKAIAALATNWRWDPGQSLPLKPRAHIAVPVGMGLAEESTSLAVVDARGLQTIDDDRVAALSVIDDRLFDPDDPTIQRYKVLAVALAACTVLDDSASLREHTLALAAVHHLTGPNLRAVDVRHALALAAAGHRRWPLCRRCQSGTVLSTGAFEDASHSPAHLCLQQAVARGLTVATA